MSSLPESSRLLFFSGHRITVQEQEIGSAKESPSLGFRSKSIANVALAWH